MYEKNEWILNKLTCLGECGKGTPPSSLVYLPVFPVAAQSCIYALEISEPPCPASDVHLHVSSEIFLNGSLSLLSLLYVVPQHGKPIHCESDFADTLSANGIGCTDSHESPSLAQTLQIILCGAHGRTRHQVPDGPEASCSDVPA